VTEIAADMRAWAGLAFDLLEKGAGDYGAR
jgi:hypothetical protein